MLTTASPLSASWGDLSMVKAMLQLLRAKYCLFMIKRLTSGFWLTART